MLCDFCDNKSIGQCACGFDSVIGCSGQVACHACMTAHKQIGKFLTALLSSRRAERSNSVRHRLLCILIEALASVRRNVSGGRPGATARAFCILREVSAFADDSEFKSTVRTALAMFPARLHSADFAEALSHVIAKHRVEASLERLGVAVSDVSPDLRADVATFLGDLVAATESGRKTAPERTEIMRGGTYSRSGRRVTARGKQLGL